MNKENLASVEVEKAVLGSMLTDKNAFETGMRLLKKSAFFDVKHQLIFEAMLILEERDESVDQVTVYSELSKLKKIKQVGPAYLSGLAKDVISAANIEEHCKIVLEKEMYRKLLDVSQSVSKAVYDGNDVFEVLGYAQSEYEKVITQTGSMRDDKNFIDRLEELLYKMEQERRDEIQSTIKTKHFPTFDYLTEGVKQGDLVIISGKYKAGKSRLAMALAIDYFVHRKVSAALVGFEMDWEEYGKNILSMATGIRYGYLRNPAAKNKDGSLILRDDLMDKLKDKSRKLFPGTEFYIIDDLSQDTDVFNKIKYLKKKKNIQMVFVDYLQLIETQKRYERKNLEIADISRKFKNLARSEKITVFLLVQENEEGKTAESKGPLRDSDFWFSISHPFDDEEKYIESQNVKVPVDQSIFWIKFKRSRHTQSGGSFVCKFYENGEFKEMDLQHYQFKEAG